MITTIAVARCSRIAASGDSFLCFAIEYERMLRIVRPTAMFIMIAVPKLKRRIGIMKLELNISFVRNVRIVASQTSLWLIFLFDSSDR